MCFFPDFGEIIPDPSLLQDSIREITYVYVNPFNLGNCSGTVTGTQFCYRLPSMENNASLLVFNLHTLNHSSEYFNVTRSITVRTTTSCNSSDNTSYYCCDFVTLSEEDRFQFPDVNVAIGITTSFDTAILQEFNSDFAPQVNSMPVYVYNTSLKYGKIYDTNDTIISDQMTPVIRLQIGKLIMKYNKVS